MSRAYTADEIRKQFLDHLSDLANYCDGLDKPCSKKLNLLVFAILNIFDGTDGALPAFELRPSPHPDDEAFYRREGENFYPTDLDIADSSRHLHEIWATEYNEV